MPQEYSHPSGLAGAFSVSSSLLLSSFLSISSAPVSNREKANHFFPKSLRDAPIW